MSVKLKILVTKEVLERSALCGIDYKHDDMETGVGMNCAIALAIKDVFPQAWTDSKYIIPFTQGLVYQDLHRLIADPGDKLITLPEIAQNFIEKFDEAEPSERVEMEPIEFEIEVSDLILSQIDISEVTKQLQDHPNLKLMEV